MRFLERLSRKIGDNLVQSNIVNAEDAEIYIYGLNQIFVSILNLSSALIIGLIFGVFFEIAVFMAAYIPLRSFAGGYHARTPLRCYFYSVMMLVIVSIGMKYPYMTDWVYYVVLAAAALVVIVLSPVEDKNKPLDEIEHKVYKKRAIIIAAIELTVSILFKLIGMDGLFIAVVYSFAVLGFMLIVGRIKNHLNRHR